MKKRILVLEDTVDLAYGLKNNLEREGYEVVVAHDGETAIELLESQHFDGAIVDLMIPGRNGFEFIAVARRRGDGPRILVLTARGGRNDRERALALGADDYLVKPFSVLELLARLEAILEEKPTVLTADQGQGGPQPARNDDGRRSVCGFRKFWRLFSGNSGHFILGWRGGRIVDAEVASTHGWAVEGT